MVRKFIFTLICLTAIQFSIPTVVQSQDGRTTPHQSDHCAIHVSAGALLRCTGNSYNVGVPSSRHQKAALSFKCFLDHFSVSLGHAMIADEVLEFTFEDNRGNSIRSGNHLKYSKVRTGFVKASTAVPVWIFERVTLDDRIERLSFELNEAEVRGKFNFTDSDRQVFEIYRHNYCDGSL